ncbi:hypothetical protein F2P79_004914 [Pimephales promelas]|nr:hypothetical protein F2P79_004914 [Pimephales promelas]
MSLGVGLTNLATLAQQEHDAHSSRGAHADGITPDLRQDEALSTKEAPRYYLTELQEPVIAHWNVKRPHIAQGLNDHTRIYQGTLENCVQSD